MRVLLTSFAAVAIGACAPVDPPPTTTCTGRDVAKAAPVERLPFHADVLTTCNAGPNAPEGATAGGELDAVAHIASTLPDLANLLGCTVPPSGVDVDFTHEEVLVLDFGDAVQVDGLFDVGGLVMAISGGPLGCRGVPPTTARSLSVLQRTGDLADVAIRSCVTVDPPPEGSQPFVCP